MKHELMRFKGKLSERELITKEIFASLNESSKSGVESV